MAVAISSHVHPWVPSVRTGVGKTTIGLDEEADDDRQPDDGVAEVLGAPAGEETAQRRLAVAAVAASVYGTAVRATVAVG